MSNTASQVLPIPNPDKRLETIETVFIKKGLRFDP